jgi:[acyl-carrier-protein] S-malonyltransferase
MKAFLFPGQASQYVGMGADLYKEFSIARDYFDRADDVLELDLKDTCFNGPEEKLIRTQYTQPAIFVHSVAVNDILKDNGIGPQVTAGHSLGEYSALVSAGAFSFEDGLRAVKLRSQLMQQCCDRYPGTMAAIVGLSLEQVKAIIKDIEGVVPANFNSPDQVAISGDKEAVGTACEKLKAAGAKRAIMLAVGGAYHSPLMGEAREGMAAYINMIEVNNFIFPVIANVTAEPITDPFTMKNLLVEQITAPVLWYPTIQKMTALGITEFYEIGPGKVLQGLLKRSMANIEYKAIGADRAADIESLIGAKV